MFLRQIQVSVLGPALAWSLLCDLVCNILPPPKYPAHFNSTSKFLSWVSRPVLMLISLASLHSDAIQWLSTFAVSGPTGLKVSRALRGECCTGECLLPYAFHLRKQQACVFIWPWEKLSNSIQSHNKNFLKETMRKERVSVPCLCLSVTSQGTRFKHSSPGSSREGPETPPFSHDCQIWCSGGPAAAGEAGVGSHACAQVLIPCFVSLVAAFTQCSLWGMLRNAL